MLGLEDGQERTAKPSECYTAASEQAVEMDEAKVTRVQALIEERRALSSENDGWMEPYRRIRAEIAGIKSEVDLETFGEIRTLELRDHGASERGLTYMQQICFCGHRQGNHGACGCTVGSVKWNQRNRRDDPHCGCQGFIEKTEAERIEAEEAEEKTRARDEAEFWCETCDDAVDEFDLTVKYECGNCGGEFTYADESSNRCPDCGKFAGKIGDDHCPDCGDQVEDLRK